MLKKVNAPVRNRTEPVRVVITPPASGGVGRMFCTVAQASPLRLFDPASGAVMAARVQPLVTGGGGVLAVVG